MTNHMVHGSNKITLKYNKITEDVSIQTFYNTYSELNKYKLLCYDNNLRAKYIRLIAVKRVMSLELVRVICTNMKQLICTKESFLKFENRSNDLWSFKNTKDAFSTRQALVYIKDKEKQYPYVLSLQCKIYEPTYIIELANRNYYCLVNGFLVKF